MSRKMGRELVASDVTFIYVKAGEALEDQTFVF